MVESINDTLGDSLTHPSVKVPGSPRPTYIAPIQHHSDAPVLHDSRIKNVSHASHIQVTYAAESLTDM